MTTTGTIPPRPNPGVRHWAMTRAQAALITEELQAAADAVLAKHGLAKNKVKSTYGDFYEFRISASPVTAGKNGVNLTSECAMCWKSSGSNYGFDPAILEELLGTQVETGGRTLFFAGIKPGRAKKFVRWQDADGNEFDGDGGTLRWLPQYEAARDIWMKTL